MIIIFIESSGERELLYKTLDSILLQPKSLQKQIQTVVLLKEEDAVWNCEHNLLSKYGTNFSLKVVYNDGNFDKRIRTEIQNSKAAYMSLIREGEAYIHNALDKAYEYLKENQDLADVAVIRNLRKEGTIPEAAKASVNGALISLEDSEKVMMLPACLRGSIFAAEAVLSCADEISADDIALDEFIYSLLEKKKTIAYMQNAFFSGESPISDKNKMYWQWGNADWYLKILDSYDQVLKKFAGHEIETFIQAQALFVLKVQFQNNANHKNKVTFTDEQKEQYFKLCCQCLNQISNVHIFRRNQIHPERKMNFAMMSAFLRLKYEGKSKDFYISEDRKQICCKGLQEGFESYVTLELLEAENDNANSEYSINHKTLKIDATIDRCIVSGALDLKVLLSGKPLEYRISNRFTQKNYFGQSVTEKFAFNVSIPINQLKKKQKLEFVLEDNSGNSIVLPILTADYQAKLTRRLQNSYWLFDNYKVTLIAAEESMPVGLQISQTGKIKNLIQEIKLLKEIATASYGSKRMFVMRCLYWLTYPVYSRKNIWLTFDKLYKGGDCGEYFYKYMCQRKNTDVVPGYVIRADVPDADRLKKEGYSILPYRSLKQKLWYMNAKMIFATHSSVHSFCGFSKWEVRFIQDRLRAVNTCIQHGLSVQDLTFDSNRIVNNNKRYYCASHCEVENLSKPAYDYAPEVLRLTGIPRYDGLVDQDKKQILITPTWRSYIAMPAVMGESRPYNPEFKNTDYYKIFQSLLENKTLSETAAKTGYRIVYLLHPVISSQKEDFRPANDIEIVSAVDVNYEKILTESSLMVTDYSGVQFDFAYMRKPVVYFHPPKLPPHYEEGGFFYDTQGFGEICREIDELVETLCSYMESGCELKPFYRARQNDFFAFDDRENCRRIYEDALQYQKDTKSKTLKTNA